MWGTNLRVLAVVLGTLGFYTLIANSIPQVESEVPQELSFTGEVSAAEMVSAGEELYAGAGGCTACHGLGTRAPNLLNPEGADGPIGARCAERVEGEDCKTYLHRSMIEPNVYVVEGFEPIMPDMRRTLSDDQIWVIVAYLQSLGGEVTVTADDLAAAGADGGDAPAAAGPETASTDPEVLLEEMQCIACHQLGGAGAAVGPAFDGIGARLDREALREGILDPAATIAEGYEQFAGVMPANFGERLTAGQLEAIVTFLEAQ